MGKIERFREICADGRVIDDRTRLADIHKRSWKPCTVVRLEWRCGEQTVQIEHAYGLMAQVLADRRSLALLRSSPRGRFADTLEFVDALGETQLTLESPVPLDGKQAIGEFAWFESPRERAPRIVRVVFWARSEDRYYLLDVNADSGFITDVFPLQ